MQSRTQLHKQNEALRARIARLTEASLRIGATLELDTVLREVVESARALTDARYGLITTVDGAGQPRDMVTSGLSEQDHRQIEQWPEGPRLFEHLRELAGPLRVPDMPSYVHKLGFSGQLLPPGAFQGTPMHHRGTHIGNFYLVEKQGGQPRVAAERRRIVQVLINLFSNAARHSPETSTIQVEAALAEAHVAISVRDAGRGVEPERLPRLFEKYPAPGDSAPAIGGGLGLAICKGLVEAHGGRIRAQSAGLGQGTRVTFTLPVTGKIPSEEPAPGRPERSPDAPARTRVLVLDDDPLTLRFVRDALTEAGYAVAVSGDPARLAESEQANDAVKESLLGDFRLWSVVELDASVSV